MTHPASQHESGWLSPLLSRGAPFPPPPAYQEVKKPQTVFFILHFEIEMSVFLLFSCSFPGESASGQKTDHTVCT